MPQQLDGCLTFPHGDYTVCSPISPFQRLDGIPGSPGCLPPGSGPSVFATLPKVLHERVCLPVPHPLLRPVDSSSGVHMCHGPGLFDNASSRFPDSPVPRRLVCCWLLLSRDSTGEGFPSLALPPLGDSDQHSQELSDSNSVARLFRDDDSDRSFEGFPDPQARSESVVSSSAFPVRQPPSSVCVAPASGSHVLRVRPGSRCEAAHVVTPTSAECRGSFPTGGHLGLLGRLLPAGSLVVVRRVPSAGGSSSRLSATNPVSVHRRLGDDQLSGLWSRDCSSFLINHQELLAVLYVVRGFLPSLQGQVVALYADNNTALAYLKKRGNLLSVPQLGGSGHPSFVRGPSHSAAASVYSGQAECAGGFSEPQVASPRL